MVLGNEGSYAFDKLKNKEDEFKRLLQQATMLPDLEINILGQHGLKEGIRILDAACGPGAISCLIKQRFNNVDVVGSDLNSNLLEVAAKTADKFGHQIEFRQEDVYNLPFSEEFDFAYTRFLFQHLQKPEQALRSLANALRPGGRLCIVDVDDGWLNLYPELSAFEQICRKARENQANLGGDRLVGRKMRNYLQDAGFSEIKVDVVAINSDQIGINDFLKITTGFKAEALATPGDKAENEFLMEEIWKAAKEKDLFGIVGVFVASGMKK